MNFRTVMWIVLCSMSALVLIVWNASALIGAKPLPRMKDLEFVPSPSVMRVMSLGHTNTVAKLRWIDAFSYLQLQFERRNDQLLGNEHEGGFDRLYNALIDLDPKFEPFYNFAIMSESLLDNPGTLAIRCAQRGCLEIPDSMNLWRNLAAHIKSMENVNLHVLDGILSAWGRAAPDEHQRYHVQRWKSNLGIMELKGLHQLDYWSYEIAQQKDNSPIGKIADSTLRQQINNYNISLLQKLYDASDLPEELGINRCLDPQAWGKVFDNKSGVSIEGALVLWGPILFSSEIIGRMEKAFQTGEGKIPVDLKGAAFRTDPYGFPYTIKDKQVYSMGRERFEFQRKLTSYSFVLSRVAIEKKTWPKDLEEVWEWLPVEPLVPPTSGTLRYEAHVIHVDYDDQQEYEEWPLKKMAQYWMYLQTDGKTP